MFRGINDSLLKKRKHKQWNQESTVTSWSCCCKLNLSKHHQCLKDGVKQRKRALETTLSNQYADRYVCFLQDASPFCESVIRTEQKMDYTVYIILWECYLRSLWPPLSAPPLLRTEHPSWRAPRPVDPRSRKSLCSSAFLLLLDGRSMSRWTCGNA